MSASEPGTGAGRDLRAQARLWLAFLVVGTACGPDLPEGRFLCFGAVDCPDGWVCRADRRCYREEEDVARDLGLDAAASDAMPRDAMLPDGEVPIETVCGNGEDDDGDGAIDCADVDCAGQRCGASGISRSATCTGATPCALVGTQSVGRSLEICIADECVRTEGARTESCPLEPAGEPCDDLLACNGTDRCDAAGQCAIHSAAPCAADETCNEVVDTCDRCSGVEASCTCSGVCGDANQSGGVNVVDASRLIGWIDGMGRPTACEFESADVDRDGSLTERDARAILALASGVVRGGCDRPCTGRCGDANQDDAVNSGDTIALQTGALDVCRLLDGDVVQDGRLDLADVFAAARVAFDGAPGACEPCERGCGDINDDGEVSAGDLVTLRTLLDGSVEDLDTCTLATADVVRDGEVTARDLVALRQIVLENVTETSCGVCEDECGDVNGDWLVDAADVDALEALLRTGEPQSYCTLIAADVDGVEGITESDVNRLRAYFRDGRTLQCPR